MTWVSPPVGRVTPPQFLQLLAHETGGNSESPARHRSDHAPRGSFLSCRITAATAAATRTATNTSRVRLIRRPPSAVVARSADAAQQPRMFPRLELSAHYSSLNPLR